MALRGFGLAHGNARTVHAEIQGGFYAVRLWLDGLAFVGCDHAPQRFGGPLDFDAIGEWRDIYASGLPIDASAAFPDGATFDGPAELRALLLSHSDDFLTTAVDRLLTYALGRGLEATDMPTVRQIMRDAADDDYRFAALVQGVVASTPFRMRMAQDRTN